MGFLYLKITISIELARPIELGTELEGEDALRFLREMKRVESLKPGDPEYEERKAYFTKCRRIAEKAEAI